jgi:hypothetical protein
VSAHAPERSSVRPQRSAPQKSASWRSSIEDIPKPWLQLLERIPPPRREFLRRNARAILTAEISTLASLLAYGSPLALPIAIASVVAILVVGLVSSERENRAREHAQQALAEERAREKAALEPIRIGSISHVARAALELIRTPMVYRDVPAAQPPQARITILEISRGTDPEGRWNIIETQVIQHRIDERRRMYAARSAHRCTSSR